MRTRSKSIFNLFTLFALLSSLLGGAVTYRPARAAGIIRYAKPDASPGGNCESWAQACTLQTTIANASFGSQIWVQAGTYKPDASNRAVSFTLKNGVAIYGGFAGNETLLSQRDPVANVTILSGDLNGNDSGFANNSENSYHVVVGSNTDSTAILDGFTISGGNANDNSANYSGGGIINNPGSPTLTNLNFSGNFAIDGGGMYNHDSSPTLSNLNFLGNSAADAGGGMMSNGNPALINVTFSDNLAASAGGGIYNAGSPTLTNVTFSGNLADFDGGGMYNTSSPTLTNVTFSGNSSAYGGGLLNIGGSGLTLVNTIFANSPNGGDCVGSTLNATSANNLIEDSANACGLTNGINGNIIGADPNLGPLANNGGPTQTYALLASSPAIDMGKDAPNCPPTDQRGVSRPWGSHCDIGSYEYATRTISGNAGTAGVILSYSDGTPKTVTSQTNGTYSIIVVAGWSGTITPSHPCFNFSPVNRSYSPVLANQTAQNYAAAFNSASGCANINVKIGSPIVGTYGIPLQGSLRVSYVGANNGPVNVTSTNGIPIIAAERILSYNDATKTKITHFSELMGLPQGLVSTTYAFPVYDNFNFDSQLRFGNVSNSSAHVRVFIGGHSGQRDEISKFITSCTTIPSMSYPPTGYVLAPGQSLRLSCKGVDGKLNAGPVQIVSDQNIVAALRVLYNNGGTVTSFSEMMGLPANSTGQWSTTYWMPWYNNVDLNSQLRFGNVSGSTATVHVYIHGVEMTSGCMEDSTHPLNSPFTIQPNESRRLRCAQNNGPVKIVSDVPIVASMRVAHFNGTDPHGNDFSELMGLPDGQKSASYLFPWYNNKTLDSQLRFGNISGSTAHVDVYIHGVKMNVNPFSLAPGASTRQSFANIDNGPVKIVSDLPIVASMRVIVNNGGWSAFSELMGLPAGQLTTSYVLPWYNNVNLDTQLRFGVP